MALKTESNNPLDYLNKLLEENGLEIIIPDDKQEEEKKETEDSNNNEE